MILPDSNVAPTAETPVGTPVHVDFRKYDGREHWQEPYRLLGVDDDGVWLGQAVGVEVARPGLSLISDAACVKLVSDAGFAAIFNDRGPNPDQTIRTYVDITTTPQWRREGDGFVVTLIDLDLDVVERFSGEVFVDDEDEFLEHQELFGYPSEVVDHARSVCDRVLAELQSGSGVYDGRGHARLSQVEG